MTERIAVPSRRNRYRSLVRGIGISLLLVLLATLLAPASGADSPGVTAEPIELDEELTDPSARREGSEEEGIAITPWLTLFGQVEWEWSRESLTPGGGGGSDTSDAAHATYQLGFLTRPWRDSELLLVLEYDTETDQLKADEASIGLEFEPWQLRAGKFYTPFGSYWGNFVSGPILEFGETRASGISLGYAADDIAEFDLMLYYGEADEEGPHSDSWDWALSLQSELSDQLSVGLSYQSDLADSDERLLTDYGDRFSRKVDALSGYIRWTTDDYELTFEVLGALGSFAELARDRDQPLAWNLELLHPLPANLQLAWRLEGSKELEDQPEVQLGVALIWEPFENASVTLEYLHGKFKRGLASDDDDQPYSHVDTFSAMLTVGF